MKGIAMTDTSPERTVEPLATPPIAPGNPPQLAMRQPSPLAWLWGGAACFVLLAGVIGFLLGEQLASSKNRIFQPSTLSIQSTVPNSVTFGFGGMRGGSRSATQGLVTAVSATSITVKNSVSGTSDTYQIDAATRVAKVDRTTGGISDVKVGDTVTIRGTSTTSGATTTLTASSIVILAVVTTSATSSSST